MVAVVKLEAFQNRVFALFAQFTRHMGFALGFVLLLAAPVALAQSSGSGLNDNKSAQTSYVDDRALDELFALLAESTNEATATPIANQIWRIWFSPSAPRLAALMEEAETAARLGNLSGAIRILNVIIKEYPDYAEGWNRRATMYFLVGNFAASFADVEEVLAREPRHFGALSGKSMMYLQLGERAKALQAMVAALRVHPYLSQRALFEELLAPPTNT